jgi:hypothetical protein
MLTRRSLGKQAAAGVTAALGMVGAAEAAMATSGQLSGASGGFTGSLPPTLAQDVLGTVDGPAHQLISNVVAIMRDQKEPANVRIGCAKWLLDIGWHI